MLLKFFLECFSTNDHWYAYHAIDFLGRHNDANRRHGDSLQGLQGIVQTIAS